MSERILRLKEEFVAAPTGWGFKRGRLVNVDTLLDAQEKTQGYRDLMVRVSGCTDYSTPIMTFHSSCVWIAVRSSPRSAMVSTSMDTLSTLAAAI